MVTNDNGDRLAPRREVLLHARCRKSSWHVFSVELGDISQGGCSIIGCPGNFDVGNTVQLRITGFRPLEAQVRWIGDDRVGVEFQLALTRAVIDDLAATYGIAIRPGPVTC